MEAVPAGYDKIKGQCFNCHKLRTFCQRMQSTKRKTTDNWNQDGTRFDWSDMAEEEIQANMALMAFSDSEDYLGLNLKRLRKKKRGLNLRLQNFEKSSKDLDQLLASQITDKSKKGFGYNAVPSPHPLILNRPTPLDLSYSGLEEFKQPEVNEYGPRDSSVKPTNGCDKESDNSKENTDDYLKQQQKTDSKTSSLKVDKDWKEKFFCPANQVREEAPKKARENNDALIIEDWVSDDEDDVESITKVEKKTVIPTATKKEFVKPETPVRRSVSCPNVHKHMVPRAVLMKTGLKTVNTTRPVNTVRQIQVSSGLVPKRITNFNKFCMQSNSQLNDKGFVDSGCSRNMSGNIAHLSDFKDFDGGYVTFSRGANGGRITGKVTDDYSRFSWVFFLRTKDETSEILKNFIKEVENLVDKKVKIIRSDNGTEFKNKVMDDFCREKVYLLNKIKNLDWHANLEGCLQYFGDASPNIVDDAQIEDKDELHDEDDATEESHDGSNLQNNGTADQQVNTARQEVNTGSREVSTALPEVNTATPEDLVGPSSASEDSHIPQSYEVPTTPHTRIHKDHPIEHVIGDVQSSVQTRRMKTSYSEKGFLSAIYEGKSHQDLHTCLFVCFLSQEEPKRISQALRDPAWVEAMQEELLSSNCKRLVAQGHTQEEGIDYDEVFVLVARIEAKRIFLCIILLIWLYGLSKCKVKSTFLYGQIEEEVYVCQPPGFEDPDHPDKVYKRQKGHILLVQIYVDDIIFGSTKKELCDEFEKLMKDKFQMSSMGELTFFLGLQVQQKKKGIFISQDKYVNEILRKYNYTDVKSASTPTDLEKPLVQDGDAADVDEHLYRSMIGSLMYLTASRPDIMFAVCACARFQVSPKTSHLLAVKRIFRYLKGKPSLGLWSANVSTAENGDVKLTATIDGHSNDYHRGIFYRRIISCLSLQIKTGKARRKARVVLSDDEVLEDDSSKQGRKLSDAEVQEKARRLSFAEAIRLEEPKCNENNSASIAREEMKRLQDNGMKRKDIRVYGWCMKCEKKKSPEKMKSAEKMESRYKLLREMKKSLKKLSKEGSSCIIQVASGVMAAPRNYKENGLAIHMLTEKKYPLSQELLFKVVRSRQNMFERNHHAKEVDRRFNSEELDDLIGQLTSLGEVVRNNIQRLNTAKYKLRVRTVMVKAAGLGV
ncbi:putative ribonuclease H-like domain-containing protein, partial [Tanacetum coccineum]